jgi:hypothetical protein
MRTFFHKLQSLLIPLLGLGFASCDDFWGRSVRDLGFCLKGVVALRFGIMPELLYERLKTIEL